MSEEIEVQGTEPESVPVEAEEQITDVRETEPDSEPDSEPSEPQKAKKSAQQRINEITKARHEAEREAAYWRGIAEGTTPKNQRAPEQSSREQAAKPNLADFTDYETYIEALTDWKTTQKVAEAQRQQQFNQEQQHRQQEAKEMARTWSERQEAVRATIPDYEEVLGNSDLIVTPVVTDILLTSDRGPEVAYHLAKNPALTAKLNGMAPLVAAREIGRIEAALGKSSITLTQKPVPAPVSPSRASMTTTKDLAKMDHEQYRSIRAKQGARWAR